MAVLPRAPGRFGFLFVAIDIFTKWMEVMSIVNITQDVAAKFLIVSYTDSAYPSASLQIMGLNSKEQSPQGAAQISVSIIRPH
jgi:hypothetical protein